MTRGPPAGPNRAPRRGAPPTREGRRRSKNPASAGVHILTTSKATTLALEPAPLLFEEGVDLRTATASSPPPRVTGESSSSRADGSHARRWGELFRTRASRAARRSRSFGLLHAPWAGPPPSRVRCAHAPGRRPRRGSRWLVSRLRRRWVGSASDAPGGEVAWCTLLAHPRRPPVHGLDDVLRAAHVTVPASRRPPRPACDGAARGARPARGAGLGFPTTSDDRGSCFCGRAGG